MRHQCEPTEGFPEECVICCQTIGDAVLMAIIEASQVYKGMHMLELYCDMPLSQQEKMPAYEAMRVILNG